MHVEKGSTLEGRLRMHTDYNCLCMRVLRQK